MSRPRFALISVFVLLAIAFAAGRPTGANAAPAGAAQGLTIYQYQCLSNGLVLARFAWAPSGWGHQFLDVSLSSNFSGWSYAGPFGAGQNNHDWYNLEPNRTYFARVGTWIGSWVHSDPISFHTPSCAGGGFSAPTNLRSNVLSSSSMRVRWDAGQNNLWYCVDTALSLDDLFNFRGTWWAHHCGTGSTVVDLNGLGCGQVHYWRVYAVGPGVSAHSAPASFVSGDCAFSVPDDLSAEVLSPTSVRFSWDRGAGNLWYCVDTAETLSHLFNFTGTFDNHGCGTTGTVVTATDLECGEQYFWRVYAAGAAGQGHSAHATVTTTACNAFTVPTNLEADSPSPTSIVFEWDPGMNNIWYCVDTATSNSDLVNFTGSYKAHGCGTTTPSITATGLTCNTQYRWRVYAFGGASSGHSVIASETTDACP
jgi:hypothetical protein